MKRIVTIERQRRSRNRYTLHFDDGEWLGLFDELIIKHGLEVGKEVDSEKLTQLAREDDAKKALEMAIRYLGYRSRSQKEMITYLEGKGFDRDLIDETMEKLEGYGYIDDSAFARDWVAGRMSSKPMGRAMIKRELIFKGVEDEVIEEHLGRISQDQEEDRAYALALKYVKRYKNLEPREQFHKIGAALARRGFDWETIKGAVRRLSIGDLDE
jgi:regulatory protein